MYPGYNFIGKEEKCKIVDISYPGQHQDCQPGLEYIMRPLPISENICYQASNKLKNKVALITGGDSGIGRSVAILFAKEGADVAISYLCEEIDALKTKSQVEAYGRKCLLIPGDLTKEENCQKAVQDVIDTFGKLDILINNCGVQFIKRSILDISSEQLEYTFRTNFFSYFYMTKAALPYLKSGSSIINTTSITAYQGNKDLIDYSATKGAITTFTRSLSLSLVSQGIRVNGVAPGPIWTPLIPASYSASEVETFGTYTSKVPMNRSGQPFEVATSYLFLASDDSRYMSGQILHPNGGAIVSS